MQNLPAFNTVSFAFDESAHTPAVPTAPTSILFSADQITLVTGVFFLYTTDATVADRYIVLNYVIGSLYHHRVVSPTPIPASTYGVFSFAIGSQHVAIPIATPQVEAPLPSHIYMREIDHLELGVINAVAGDSITALRTTQLVWRLAR